MTAKVIQQGAAVLITQERYAEIADLPLYYVKNLCSQACEKWRCAKQFDERDLKRFSKKVVRIWYQPSNMANGWDRPRLLDRDDLSDSMATSTAKRGAVSDKTEKASPKGSLFSTDEFEGDD